jgi:hypothetical protein
LKKIALLTFSFWCCSPFASTCDKNRTYHSQCELSENGQALELVTLKTACSQTKSDKPVDCFFVRTCDKNIDNRKSSMVIHNTTAHMTTLCDDLTKGESLFYNSSDEGKKNGFKVFIKCDDKKRPLLVRLESPKGIKKSCPVFFFEKPL